MSEETTRVYELGFLMVPTVTEGEVDAEVATLVKMLEKHAGKIVAQGTPEFIDLAYTMERDIASKKYKYSQGYFGWIKFESDPSTLEDIKKALDGVKALIRYILVKTNVANTIVFKKPKVEAKRPLEADGEVITMDAEEADVAADDDMLAVHEKLPTLDEEATASEPQEEDETI